MACHAACKAGKAGESHETRKKAGGSSKKPKKQDSLLYWSIALIIAAIIFFIAAGKFFSGEKGYETIEYNNWEFTNVEGMWWFQWQKEGKLYTVPLRYSPYEAEEIPITGHFDSGLFNAQDNIYVTFDLSNESSQDLPILALAATELTQNMATAIGRVPIAACTNNNSYACEERPVKTCENTDEPVIYINEGNEPSITLKRNCIQIEGEGLGLVKAVDRLLYQWYGIIQ